MKDVGQIEFLLRKGLKLLNLKSSIYIEHGV